MPRNLAKSRGHATGAWSNNNPHALMTHQEVADILSARGETITKGGVFMAEQRALEKLRDGLHSVAVELYGNHFTEAD